MTTPLRPGILAVLISSVKIDKRAYSKADLHSKQCYMGPKDSVLRS